MRHFVYEIQLKTTTSINSDMLTATVINVTGLAMVIAGVVEGKGYLQEREKAASERITCRLLDPKNKLFLSFNQQCNGSVVKTFLLDLCWRQLDCTPRRIRQTCRKFKGLIKRFYRKQILINGGVDQQKISKLLSVQVFTFIMEERVRVDSYIAYGTGGYMQNEKKGPPQVEGMVLKTVNQYFADELLPFLGITVKAVAAAPTELVKLDIRKTFQDYNFVLEDDSWAHLEFESDALTIKDLRRFREYEATTSNVYQVSITTYVVLSGVHKNVRTQIECGVNTYRIIPIWLPEHNADELIRELEQKKSEGVPICEDELVFLVLTPLMSGESSQKDRIIRSLQLLRDYSSLEDSWKLEKMQAALYALANKFLDRADLDKVKEVIRMTILGQMLKDEGIQEGLEKGLKEGMEEGIRALVETFQELGIPKDIAREKLMQKFQLSLEAADDALARY